MNDEGGTDPGASLLRQHVLASVRQASVTRREPVTEICKTVPDQVFWLSRRELGALRNWDDPHRETVTVLGREQPPNSRGNLFEAFRSLNRD